MLSGNNAAQVVAFTVGPGDIGSLVERGIGDHRNFSSWGEPHWPEESGFHARVLFDFCTVGRAKIAGQTPKFFFVQFLVAAN